MTNNSPKASTITATAQCDYCHWQCRMSGDSPLEVATFLRARLIEHVVVCHPLGHPS